MHHLLGRCEKVSAEGYVVVESLNGFGEPQVAVTFGKDPGSFADVNPVLTVEGDTFYYSHTKESVSGGLPTLVYTRGLHVGDTVRASSMLKRFKITDIVEREDGKTLVQGYLDTGSSFSTDEPIFMERRQGDKPVKSCRVNPNNFQRGT